MSNIKPTNPKEFEGMKKIPYHLFPMSAVAVGAIQMLDGGTKYGRENWREMGVKSSTYVDACIRHVFDWFHGRNRTPDTNLRSLGGALCCIAILIDSDVNGNLVDDRAYKNKFDALVKELDKEIPRIKNLNKDKHPAHHFSALDLIKQVIKTHGRKQTTRHKRKKR